MFPYKLTTGFFVFLASLSVIIPLYTSLYYLYCNWFVQKKKLSFLKKTISDAYQFGFSSYSEYQQRKRKSSKKPFTKPGDSFHQCETLSFQKHHSRYNYTFFFLNIFFSFNTVGLAYCTLRLYGYYRNHNHTVLEPVH